MRAICLLCCLQLHKFARATNHWFNMELSCFETRPLNAHDFMSLHCLSVYASASANHSLLHLGTYSLRSLFVNKTTIALVIVFILKNHICSRCYYQALTIFSTLNSQQINIKGVTMLHSRIIWNMIVCYSKFILQTIFLCLFVFHHAYRHSACLFG